MAYTEIVKYFSAYAFVIQLQAIFIGCFPTQVFSASAPVAVERLGIIGIDAASSVNPAPFDAPYSWISRVYTGGASIITWRLHPGTDGGVVLSLPQPPRTLTAEFVMLNFNTTLFTVGAGITSDVNYTLDMTNFRKQANTTIFDLGSGPGVNPLVPLITDVTALFPGENGWQLNTNGTYYLIYNTHAECSGCSHIIHLYGDQLEAGSHGDVNLDGDVNTGDILVMQRYLSGLTDLTADQQQQADLAPPGMGNGLLDLSDLLQIMSRVVETR